MNATAFDGGKVHLLTDQAARCGVGKHGKHRQWQTELGQVTCQRCVKLGAVALKHLPAAGGEGKGEAQRGGAEVR